MLERGFYARPTLAVARDLLGAVLVHHPPAGERRAGRIVETEAYAGPHDAASHARSGPGGRAAIMYGAPGFAYVYLIYGVYHCFNAVTETRDVAGAVLVRAVEPLGLAVGERGSGPGLACRSLRIERACTGLDLTLPSSSLFIERGCPMPNAAVRVGPRVGVAYSGDWAAKPWRLWVADSPHVSRHGAGAAFDPALLQTALT